ncbi:hypothetical protein P3T73_08440 [Kiritimatiellota bacterium B12222]|nr:hypothetical protein P3T73_08440 [Kiritimatiellota bacterium B12222]
MASLFIVWHVAAMVIGPGPGSYLMSKVYPVWRPYLRLLHLENYWAFFAPEPSAGKWVRYVIEDDHGNLHFFKLAEELDRNDPLFFRHSSLITDITEPPSAGTLGIAAALGQKHQDLNPTRIQFVIGWQLPIRREAYLEGKRPYDSEFIEFEYLTPLVFPIEFHPSPPPAPTADPET